MKKVIIASLFIGVCLISNAAYAEEEWLPGARSANEIEDLRIARDADSGVLLLNSHLDADRLEDTTEKEYVGTSSGMFDTLRPDGSLSSDRCDEMNPVRSNLD